MSRKIPPEEAFQLYASMGAERSYERVAQHYGSSKRAVVKRATKDGWQRRLSAIEARAQERNDQTLVETYASATERHLKTLRAIQARALKALGKLEISTGIQAVRALHLAIQEEQRLLKPPGSKHGDGRTLADILGDTIRRGEEAQGRRAEGAASTNDREHLSARGS